MARDDIWRTHCGKIGQVDEHRSIHENFRGTSCSNGKGTDPEAGEAGEAGKKTGAARLRTVAQRLAKTPSTPEIPRVKWEPLLRIREEPSIACLLFT